ncbi:Amino Acid/Auxin Permease [Phytophthora megakarya]|uniref:Amino Acid/Auxin Permease n=1 Tax=Phytophthora megakarya TaxID=4795 RepID=A0A225UW65_9STRA|nr:Amino Acid/Auxin Permease [Phytophthora megakarya]
MQLHITIAFSVILNPAFYLAERLVLNMHQKKDDEDIENALTYAASSYIAATTPGKDPVNGDDRRSSKMSYISNADAENPHYGDVEAEAAEYRGLNAIKYVVLRVAIIAALVVLSVILKDHFTDLVDFVGASCVTLISIVLPIIFLLMKLWHEIPLYEKIPALIVVIVCGFLGCYVTYTSGKTLFAPSVVIVCGFLGCYVTYTSGKTLFAPSESDTEFPYCDSEFENEVYYNYTAVHGA